MVKLFAKSGYPDQTLHYAAASVLGLYCLPITHLGVSRLNWLFFTRAEPQLFSNKSVYSYKDLDNKLFQ